MMSRNTKKTPTKSSVFEYFTISEDRKYFVCQCVIEDEEKLCQVKISTFSGNDKCAPTRAYNLKRHLERTHPKILDNVNEKDKKNHAAKPTTFVQTSLSSFFKSDKVTITMTANTFKKHLIDLVVNNGIALHIFSQPAFLGINGEMAIKLGVSLQRQSVRKLIIDEAKSKKEVKKSLQGKFVFLKMDAATRYRVNYFAINVRFVNNDNQIITQTLAVKDTKAHHDSTYLQNLIEEVLKEFEIKKTQVLCIVTDNASNMIKTIEKINESKSNENVSDISTERVCVVDNEITDAEYTYEALDDIVEESSKLCLIKHMHCAVHTLQLAIRDGLKEPHTATLISKVRQVAITARTLKIDAILQRRLRKEAIIDQATRWGSTYMMVQRVLELKSSLEDLDNQNVMLNTAQWNEVTQLETLLSYPFAATKKLQADLTAGAFLWEWNNLIYHLSQRGGLIANGIVSSMKKREALMLENEMLLAAVFIDPSNRILLTEQQINQAKTALSDLAIRMKGFLQSEVKQQSLYSHSFQEDVAEIENQSSSSSDELNFEKYLNKMEKEKVKRRRLEINIPVNIKMTVFKKEFDAALHEIEKYGRSCKVPLHDLLKIYPEVARDAAITVNALPPTQVSVERLFSALKLIKSDLRSSMKEDLAEAILFLRNMK